MRTKRFQNRITAGRFTLPTAILISVSCWILTAVLLPETETQQSGYSLWGNILRLLHPHLGKPSLQLYSVCRHRVLPNTAQQYVRHHPDAGIGTDFCLLPADIRLPQPAHAVCGRLGSRLLPGGTVFSSSRATSRHGPQAVSSTPLSSSDWAACFFRSSCCLSPSSDSAYNFQSLQPKSFFDFLGRMEQYPTGCCWDTPSTTGKWNSSASPSASW